MYGIDISKQRFDEQDKQIIQHVLSGEWKVKRCLILGSGEGRIGVVLALFGFEVVCIDIDDYSNYYQQVNRVFDLKKPIVFIQQSMKDVQKSEDIHGFTLVLAQRVLHYLPYYEIRKLLETLPKVMAKKSSLYVAVSCVDSAMGDGYEGKQLPVEERFHTLSDEMKERFSLSVPVCLFSLKDFKTLMKKTQFTKKKLYQTAFRNIKGMYQL